MGRFVGAVTSCSHPSKWAAPTMMRRNWPVRSLTHVLRKETRKRDPPPFAEGECQQCMQEQMSWLKRNNNWKGKINTYHCLSHPAVSVVHFAHHVGSETWAVPYHVVEPMAWEYPYQGDQVQEGVEDRLVMAGL